MFLESKFEIIATSIVVSWPRFKFGTLKIQEIRQRMYLTKYYIIHDDVRDFEVRFISNI